MLVKRNQFLEEFREQYIKKHLDSNKDMYDMFTIKSNFNTN